MAYLITSGRFEAPAGGTIETYRAGTMIPQTTYTTRGGTVPNPTTISVPASGYVSVWGGDGLAYRFIVRDADGVVLYDTDGIDAGAQPASAVSDWASPETFGAVGDGAATDTAAMQSAINTGKHVRGTPGKTYLVGPLVATTQGQSLDFRGCTVRRVNNSAHAPMLWLQGQRQQVVGGTWDGNKANQAGNGDEQYSHAAIAISADYCSVTGVHAINSYGMGIKGAECSYAAIRENRCIDNTLYQIYVEGVSANRYGNVIAGNLCSSASIDISSGIYLSGSNDYGYKQYRWVVSGNICVGSTANPSGIGITTRAVHGRISDNTVTGYTMSISSDSAENTTIVGNQCSSTAGASNYGIELNGPRNTVSANVVKGSKYGICLSGTVSDQSYNTITGNVIDGSERSIFAQAGSNPARHLNITGNTLVHGGTLTGQAGIYLQADCMYSHIGGNNITGPGSAIASCRAVFLDGVGSGVSIVGNRMGGWEKALGLYSGASMAYTDITFMANDCTADMPAAASLVSVEGSATSGARVVNVLNTTSSGYTAA